MDGSPTAGSLLLRAPGGQRAALREAPRLDRSTPLDMSRAAGDEIAAPGRHERGERNSSRKEPVMVGNIAFLAAGLGAGLCVLGAAFGIGRICAAAMDGTARQPSASGDIR